MRPVAHCIGAIISGLVAVVMFPGRIVAETDPVLKRARVLAETGTRVGSFLILETGPRLERARDMDGGTRR